MAATECESCGGKVNEQATACPHCGAKRTNIVRGKLTKEEVRALIATDTSISEDEGRGVAETLLFPHPETRGTARAVEIVLTVMCAPLVIVGIGGMMLGRSRMRFLYRTARGEGLSAFIMTVFGGISFWTVLDILHVPSAFSITVACAMCLWIRAYIRSRTQAWRSRELTRLVKAEQGRPSKPAQLPAARAVSAPVTVPTAPRVEPPRAEPTTPAGDEPRLLR
jgi:hypothetical protein